MPVNDPVRHSEQHRGWATLFNLKKRVRTPSILQIEATECGAAALGIILGFHKCYVPLETLRTLCDVSRDGVRASSILKAARQFGLEAKGHRVGIGTLTQLSPPYIAFWNLCHYIVVEGITAKGVYLNDPISGHCSMSLQEFQSAYSGVVLEFSPGPEFKKSGSPPSVWQALLRRLKGHKVSLTHLIFATLVLVLPNLLIPVFIRVYIDDVIQAHQIEWMKPLVLMMLIAGATKGLIVWIQQESLFRMELRISLRTSAEFFWHILQLPCEFFYRRLGGEIASRIDMNDRVAGLLSGQLANYLVNLFIVGTYAALMIQYDRMLTAIGVSLALLNFLFLQVVANLRKSENSRVLGLRGQAMGVLMETVQYIETVKASGEEARSFARWAELQVKRINSEQQLGVVTRLLGMLPSMLAAISCILIIVVGGSRVIGGVLTIGVLVAFQNLLVSFEAPIGSMVGMGAQLQEVHGELRRLEDALQYPVEPDAALAIPACAIPSITTAELGLMLELKHVTFGYNRFEVPLEGVNLRIDSGQRLVIVGLSGAGKTTLALIVLGLIKPWSGEILIDGIPLHSLPRSIRASSLAMVNQTPHLFEGTVRENLTLWDKSIDQRQIQKAAEDACIHDVICSRMHGYDSVVEEFGRNFSGGERQRLEIARALVSNPRLVVFDEATNALDPETEARVYERLLQRRCTCLVIAHSQMTITHADSIAVLSQGRIVQQGSHLSLIREEGAYRTLFNSDSLQFAQPDLSTCL